MKLPLAFYRQSRLTAHLDQYILNNFLVCTRISIDDANCNLWFLILFILICDKVAIIIVLFGFLLVYQVSTAKVLKNDENIFKRAQA